MTDIAIVVLAAGQGTRMKSALPKVLHKAAGRTLLAHVLHAVKPLNPAKTVVVAGPDMEAGAAEANAPLPRCGMAIHEERLGTGHAVALAAGAFGGGPGTT